MWKRKKNKLLIITIVSVAGLIVFAFYYFFFTFAGSNFLVKLAFSRHVSAENISFEKAKGNLAQGLIYENFTLTDLKVLPEGSSLRAQRLTASFKPFELGFKADIHNGTLRMPGFDIILFYGSLGKDSIGINLALRSLSVEKLVDLLELDEFKGVSGQLNNLDFYLKGSFSSPELTGNLKIDYLTQERFSLRKAYAGFNLELRDLASQPRLFGQIALNEGVFSYPRAALIELKEGKIFFRGPPDKPFFEIKAFSVVENTRINISLEGIPDNLQLTLQSIPAFSEERLLLMLATNRSWQASQAALAEGQISGDLAKEFFNYFIFSRPAGKIAELLRASGFFLEYDGQILGIKATKDISETISVGIKKELGSERDIEQNKDRLDTEAILKFKQDF